MSSVPKGSGGERGAKERTDPEVNEEVIWTCIFSRHHHRPKYLSYATVTSSTAKFQSKPIHDVCKTRK